MSDDIQDDLDDTILHPTVEQMLHELQESRADIAAGRVVSGEEVLAKMQRKIDAYLKARANGNGYPVGQG